MNGFVTHDRWAYGWWTGKGRIDWNIGGRTEGCSMFTWWFVFERGSCRKWKTPHNFIRVTECSDELCRW